MSVVGIDIGNAFCVVAAAGKGGVDVVLNEESKRETPTCVAIGERQRFLGAAAASPTPGTTVVSQIKRLIGRPRCDPGLENDLKTLFPKLKVSEDTQGYPLLHFQHRGEEVELSPTQLLGMLLGSLKRSAERHLSVPVSDCCIAVPAHFNDVQRRAVLHAAEIAGLRPLRLLHDSSAAAIEYGIYRGDFPADRRERPHVAAFVDIGHSSTQVAIAGFCSGNVRILARAADPNLGGRDFDGVLFRHFADKLKAEDPNIDVSKSARASARLRTACEKVKKVLSANPEATLHIECFMEDKDASSPITREEFERICKPLLQRLKLPLQKALAEAGLTPKGVEAVELIGSGSRVPSVVKAVAEEFNQEPRRTLNASECVARGCALQAAMLSPAFQVKKFKIHENVPFAIDACWKEIIPKIPDGFLEIPHRGQILAKGDHFPTIKPFAFDMKGNTFTFNLEYGDATENQFTRVISTCEVGPLDITQSESTSFIVDVRLDDRGIVSVDSVTMLLDKDKASDSLAMLIKDDDSRKQTDENPSLSHPTQIEQEALKPASKLGHDSRMPENELPNNSKDVGSASATLMLDIDQTSNPLVEPIEDGSRMRIDENYKTPKGEYTNNNKDVPTASTTLRDFLATRPPSEGKDMIQVPFAERIYGSFSAEGLKMAKNTESKMAECDKQVEVAKDRKNALESYVLEMRNKIQVRGKYYEFVEESARQVFIKRLQEAETWLYGEGEDLECVAYTDKLDELKRLGDPIEMRFRESSEREAAVEMLRSRIHFLWDLADGKGPEFTHLGKQFRTKIQEDCQQLARWLDVQVALQESLDKWEGPVITVAEIQSKGALLERFYKANRRSLPPPKSDNTGFRRHLKQSQEDGKEKASQAQHDARRQLDQERDLESLHPQQQFQRENVGASPQLLDDRTHSCCGIQQSQDTPSPTQDRGEEAEWQQDSGKHPENSHPGKQPLGDESFRAKYDEGNPQSQQEYSVSLRNYMKPTQAATSKQSKKKGHSHGLQQPPQQARNQSSTWVTTAVGFFGSKLLGSSQCQECSAVEHRHNLRVQSSSPVLASTRPPYNSQGHPQPRAYKLSGQPVVGLHHSSGNQAFCDDPQPPPPPNAPGSPGIEYRKLTNEVLQDDEHFLESQRHGNGMHHGQAQTAYDPPIMPQSQPLAGSEPTRPRDRGLVPRGPPCQPESRDGASRDKGRSGSSSYS